MDKKHIGDVEHALKNGNRFYTESNDKNWNELVEQGFAIKRAGWEEDMAYFQVTTEGRQALNETYK